MTRFIVRVVFVLSLGLFGIPHSANAGERPVAPMPRVVEADPFDLTYLPPGCGVPGEPKLIVALRPTVLFARPDTQKAVEVADEMLRMVSGVLGVTILDGPGFAGIDTILFAGNVTFKRDEGAEKPNSVVGFANGMVVRTREDYNWVAALKHWYPAAKKTKHRGATIYAVPVPPALAELIPKTDKSDDIGAMFAVYVPDDRTLVAGPEASIHKLIDRIKDGDKVTTPVGWEDVDRAAVAISVEVSDKTVIDKLPGRDLKEAKTAYRIARLTDAAVFGLWAGKNTSLRMTFTATNAKSARQVTRDLRSLHPALDATLHKPPDDDQTAAEAGLVKVAQGLSADGHIEQSGATVRVKAETPLSLADYLISIMAECHPSAAKK